MIAREQAEHFCPLKPNADATTRIDRSVQIGSRANDDGIFAAHFKDGSLDPDLAGLCLRRTLMDFKADALGSGEGDEAGPGIFDNGVAEARA